MKKIIFSALAFLTMFSSLSHSFLDKKIAELQKPAPNFELTGIDGKTIKLTDLQGKIVVLHFWSATCPFVVRYEERLQNLVKNYQDKNVVVLGIDSNVTETPEQINSVAKERNVNYPILLDPQHKTADDYGAVTTPHVYIVDPSGNLVYEGSVDDQGWNENNPTNKHYVRDALDNLIAGKPVDPAKTSTFGCTVKRENPKGK